MGGCSSGEMGWNTVSESVFLLFLRTFYTYIWLYIFLPEMNLFIKFTYSFLSKVAETSIKESESIRVSES